MIEATRDAKVRTFPERSAWEDPRSVTTVVRGDDDDEDDLVLAAAVAGEATSAGAGDQGFATVGTYRGVTIISPRDFLSRPERQETEVA